MKVIISGGGTGGHIYPAIAIANELKALDPHTEFLFVGAIGKMEMEKVPAAGYPIEGLWISGLQRSLSLDNLSFPFKLLSSLRKARSIIQKFKPDLVIGVGGFASGPLLYMASRMKIPCLIQEQNSYAGLTNKWLAKKVDTICVAYENMERFFPKEKIVLTGNPVRRDILNLNSKKEEAYRFFELNPMKKTLFAFGGSQGARSINESISRHLDAIVAQDIQIIWQTGKNPFQQTSENNDLLKSPLVKQFEFIYRMDLAYSVADVIIARSGASTVSEACIAAKPMIFVPLPTAAEDHQTKNALALTQKDAAELVPNSDAREQLIPKALALLQNPERCQTLSRNIQAFAQPDATSKIVEEVLKLNKNK